MQLCCVFMSYVFLAQCTFCVVMHAMLLTLLKLEILRKFYIYVIRSFIFIAQIMFTCLIIYHILYHIPILYHIIFLFFIFCYIFLFSYYLILNLCYNIFIFTLCKNNHSSYRTIGKTVITCRLSYHAHWVTITHQCKQQCVA